VLTQGEIDFNNAMVWLQDKQNDGLEDSKYFKKLNSMIRTTPGQTNEQRAKELVKALQWVRKTSATKEGKRNIFGSIAKEGGKGITEEQPKAEPKAEPKSRKLKTNGSVANEKQIAKQKATKRWDKLKANAPSIVPDRDTANALQWLNKEGGGHMEDEENFRKLDAMLPTKAGQSPEDRAAEMGKAMKFLRKKGIDGRQKEASVSVESPERETDEPPNQKSTHAQQIANATKFLSATLEGSDTSQVEDAKYFNKLDNMLPKKTNQTT
jgi:hypothetical protein